MAWSIVAVVEDGEKGFLRDLDVPYLFHTLLALFLLLQQLSFARNVAAVALGRDILAQGRDRFARDHPAADGRLDRHLELVPLDFAPQFLDQFAAPAVGMGLVHDG